MPERFNNSMSGTSPCLAQQQSKTSAINLVLSSKSVLPLAPGAGTWHRVTEEGPPSIFRAQALVWRKDPPVTGT
jgi:hypothetical protein